MEPEIIAHRGYSAVAPENTIAALEAALEADASSVEVDVRTAIDGTPVLFHDIHLGRTSSGVGPVRRRTVQQLKSLDVGSWFSEEFAGETIPTLAEALECVQGRIDRLYLDVKGYREMEDLDRIVEITRSADLLSRTTFLSKDRTVLDRIGQTEPSVNLGCVVEDEETVTLALERAQGERRTFLALESSLALDRPELIRSARQREVEVGVWTVDLPEDAQDLWDAGVTRFTTDDLETMRAWAEGF